MLTSFRVDLSFCFFSLIIFECFISVLSSFRDAVTSVSLHSVSVSLVEWYIMCGSTLKHMVLGGVLAWRQVSMKVLWWLALASVISDAFEFFFCLSLGKVWFVLVLG